MIEIPIISLYFLFACVVIYSIIFNIKRDYFANYSSEFVYILGIICTGITVIVGFIAIFFSIITNV